MQSFLISRLLAGCALVAMTAFAVTSNHPEGLILLGVVWISVLTLLAIQTRFGRIDTTMVQPLNMLVLMAVLAIIVAYFSGVMTAGGRHKAYVGVATQR